MKSQLPRIERLLNGVWELSPGPRDVPPGTWAHHVQVPALVDAAVPAFAWQESDFHWYRLTFEAPESLFYATCLLKIEQAMFGTEVWLNGHHLGGNIACYTSQEYNVRDAIHSDRTNELLVRVGGRHTLPPESAVGKDQERTTFIPGIWGDVWLIFTGAQRVKYVQAIPHIVRKKADIIVTVENRPPISRDIHVDISIVERSTGRKASHQTSARRTIGPAGECAIRFQVTVREMHLWSPEDPFLYEAHVRVREGRNIVDEARTVFGMREFKVSKGDFLLNGKPIHLRGGNIAFHRFLSSSDRGLLPWNMDWVKKVLIDIPREHNFNFFRNHLGQMYNRWYDVADAHGMLMQNEWQFWKPSGSKEQITREFTQWLKDNWNHPSIVIWDALNESSDDVVQHEVVPLMKKLDPTRPWESVDFVEEHPYIYSLGPVLNDRRFGFARALDDFRSLRTPSVLNEFLWWWLDRDGNPTPLTEEVVERWLGRGATRKQLLVHQAFLAGELVELFRRMEIDAIQPFVYLSANEGPTSHWFLGPIEQLHPKPVLQALKNAFSPLGLSIELWDRHFNAGERRIVDVHVFNDLGRDVRAGVKYGIQDEEGKWCTSASIRCDVRSAMKVVRKCTVTFPSVPGRYAVHAEVYERAGTPVAVSRKPAHVFGMMKIPEGLARRRALVMPGALAETGAFLKEMKIEPVDLRKVSADDQDLVILTGEDLRTPEYASRRDELQHFVEQGHSLILLEPEAGIVMKRPLMVFQDFVLAVEPRADTEKGGYDSCVFMDQPKHPVWNGIDPDHLKFFNGGYGGIIVSQHTVIPQLPYVVLASCGLKLSVPALMEAREGKGRVYISRIQTRGRLNATKRSGKLFDRREDAVARRYFLNLISCAVHP